MAFEFAVTPVAWVGVGCPAALPAAAAFWGEGLAASQSFLGSDADWVVTLSWAGPAPTDWQVSVSLQSTYFGSGACPAVGDVCSGVVTLTTGIPGMCDLVVDVTIPMRVNMSDMVTRAYFDELLSAGGDLLRWEHTHTPPPAAVRYEVEGSGLLWVSGHPRGLTYKLGSRGEPRASPTVVRYFFT